MFHGKKLNAVLILGTSKDVLSPLLVNTVLKVLANAIRQEKKNRHPCWKGRSGTLYSRQHERDFLVVQWLRILLPMQGIQVWSLVWEESTFCGATKLMCHNPWACLPRACALQQEKPLQWEAGALSEEQPLLAATRESLCATAKTQCNQK